MTEDTKTEVAEELIKRAFGEENRARLINAYFDTRHQTEISAAQAWAHVYRLLLWVDHTTGLGHCYESDKCQPGRPWYQRSLGFHDWLSKSLDVAPSEVASEIDRLFAQATRELANAGKQTRESLAAKFAAQWAPYDGRSFPRPGQDPKLITLVKEALAGHLSAADPTPEVWERLVERIWQYFAQENKRKNLLGEGFEDVLAQVIRRTCKPAPQVFVRAPLQLLPGFRAPPEDEKAIKVDLAIADPLTLITVKWSVRADRERQFESDIEDYTGAVSKRQIFDYVLVTNEFDPARLERACNATYGSGRLFAHVVHINTDAIRSTYAASKASPKIRAVLELIDEGRLLSLADWLRQLDSPR